MTMHGTHKIPITILICDHDEDARSLTRRALEDAHIVNELKFVNDGEQLLDYLQRRGAYAGETGAAPRPGLILLDLEMPRMHGREALERINDDPTLVDIPVTILTTPRRGADVVDGRRLGVRAFITKPVTFEGLVGAMNVLGGYWLQIVESPPTRS
jgi:two-component system response regulator